MQLNWNTTSVGGLLISIGFVHKARHSDTANFMWTEIHWCAKYIVEHRIVWYCSFFPGKKIRFSVVFLGFVFFIRFHFITLLFPRIIAMLYKQKLNMAKLLRRQRLSTCFQVNIVNIITHYFPTIRSVRFDFT